jgi:SOS-response transcriptional repressor LexA
LSRYLPEGHEGHKLVMPKIPVLGAIAAGTGREEPADDGDQIEPMAWWRGCVAYRAKGNSMESAGIHDGDYLVVRPVDDTPAQPGQIVVAWIEGGHVVKRLDARGYLRGDGRWAHKLRDGDRVLGVLVSIIRRV